MAYTGYLISLRTSASDSHPYNIPLSSISLDTYKVTKYVQDVDSYRDANGVLHRTALNAKVVKVEFDTRNQMNNTEFASMMASIRAKFVSALNNQKAVYVTAYIPDEDTYVSQYAYLADVTPQIYRATGSTVYYDSTRIAFIGYGTNVLSDITL